MTAVAEVLTVTLRMWQVLGLNNHMTAASNLAGVVQRKATQSCGLLLSRPFTSQVATKVRGGDGFRRQSPLELRRWCVVAYGCAGKMLRQVVARPLQPHLCFGVVGADDNHRIEVRHEGLDQSNGMFGDVMIDLSDSQLNIVQPVARYKTGKNGLLVVMVVGPILMEVGVYELAQLVVGAVFHGCSRHRERSQNIIELSLEGLCECVTSG